MPIKITITVTNKPIIILFMIRKLIN
jgi:hypothetical protein